MFDQVSSDIKDAMKNKEKERLDALRMLKSRLLENKTSKKPIAEQEVAIKYCKMLKDSLEQFPQGSEQYVKVETEIKFLSPYLPEQLSEDKVREIISQIISDNEGANFGTVMKALSPQIKGKFDGKLASQMVKEVLA
ncbi:MAG: GatB/YqeY domain-containing protein [Oligoflexales bacterium]|nr:GatB/YqeY domain-containing protein [Oligoflexales bacterium]